MKEFFKKLPTATIVLLILTFMFGVWGVYQSKLASDYNVDIIETDECLPANDGQLVYTTGKLTVDEPAQEVEYDITTDGEPLVIIRTVEMYQYTISGDDVVKSFLEYQNYDIEGRGGEKYDNPDFPDDMHSAVMYSKALINDEFVVDEAYLDELATNIDTGALYSVAKVNLPGYTKCEGDYYTKADPNNWKIGDVRIKFTYLRADALDEVSILGVQDDEKLTPKDALISRVDCPIISLADIRADMTGDPSAASKGLYIIAGGCFIAGAVIYFVKSKKSGGAV